MFLKKLNLINTSSYIWSRYEMSVVYAFILVSVKEDQEGISVNVNESRQCYESAIQSILEKNKRKKQTFTMFWAELQLNQTLWKCRIFFFFLKFTLPPRKVLNIEKQRGHVRLTLMPPGKWSPFAPSSVSHGKRQAVWDGGRSASWEQEGVREYFLLLLHFINKLFLFQDRCVEASVALLQEDHISQNLKCITHHFSCRKCDNI